MRLMNLITECTDYAVMCHENFHGTTSISAADLKESTPLRCNLPTSDLKLRNMAIEANKDLLKSFASACNGTDPRWKLLRVDIRNGKLHLAFADTLDKNSSQYPTEIIEFCAGELLFWVRAGSNGNSCSESYEFNFMGDMDMEKDELGRRHIATIVEDQKGKPSRYQYLYLYDNGKYYLDQEVYNL